VSSSAERLVYDRADHDVALVRRAGIAVVTIGGALLAALAQTWWAYGIALGGFVAVRFWARHASAERARAPALEGKALLLGEDAIEVPREDGSVTRVGWRELERVEVDHDRLVIVLCTPSGEESIEPHFGGLGLDELARRIDARLRERRGPLAVSASR